ncbi:30S ribosomal protein S17e [Candidatus Woesearchaeota archaeon]|nr:30S ribosomal protein S17e [Candidatus Woesearchaeota archaeon]
MGRIKTQLIKKSAESIVKAFSQKLTPNFEQNKLFLAQNLKVSSKKLRNAIIGYATRLVKLNKIE